jgi:hypothetical protein
LPIVSSSSIGHTKQAASHCSRRRVPTLASMAARTASSCWQQRDTARIAIDAPLLRRKAHSRRRARCRASLEFATDP